MENKILALLVNDPVRGFIAIFVTFAFVSMSVYYGWHFHETLEDIVHLIKSFVKCRKNRKKS